MEKTQFSFAFHRRNLFLTSSKNLLKVRLILTGLILSSSLSVCVRSTNWTFLFLLRSESDVLDDDDTESSSGFLVTVRLIEEVSLKFSSCVSAEDFGIAFAESREFPERFAFSFCAFNCSLVDVVRRRCVKI